MGAGTTLAVVAITAGVAGAAGYYMGGQQAPVKFKYVEPLPEAEQIAQNILIRHTANGIVHITSRHCIHTATGAWGKRCTYVMRVGDDVEAIMDVVYAEYPEGWFWTIEVGRLTWGKLEINASGRQFVMDAVFGDEVIHPGYVSFRILAGTLRLQ